MNNYKILAIIPARGGSKGIPRKNMAKLNGKPLLCHSIETAIQVKEINNIVVTTEDEEIFNTAKKYKKIKVIRRPPELSQDTTPTLPVLKHSIEYLESNEQLTPDIIILLQPTSPFRNIDDIKNCINKLIKEKCDTVISVKKLTYPIEWVLKKEKNDKIINYFPDNKIQRRQDKKEQLYLPNGSIFVFWYDTLMKKHMIKGPDTRAYLMSEENSIDIDTNFDFLIAEKIIEKMKQDETNKNK